MKKIAWVLPMLAFAGCFSGGAESAYPLYGAEGPPLPAAQVAILSGPIDSVDDRRVQRLGTSFALRPGCHDVTNRREWGGSDGMSATIAHLPGLTFAVPMRAGYSYVLEIAGGPAGVAISMSERNPNGDVTQRFDPGTPCTPPVASTSRGLDYNRL